MHCVRKGILTTALLVGCAQTPDDSPRVEDPSAPTADSPTLALPEPPTAPEADSLRNALSVVGAGIGDSRRSIIARFGAPLRTAASTASNQQGYGTDSLFAVHFESLRVNILQSGYDRREFITDVDLTGNALTLPGGLLIGQTDTTSVVSRLGIPDYRTATGDTLSWQYEVPVPERNGLVSLHFVRGLLRRVLWLPYVG